MRRWSLAAWRKQRLELGEELGLKKGVEFLVFHVFFFLNWFSFPLFYFVNELNIGVNMVIPLFDLVLAFGC